MTRIESEWIVAWAIIQARLIPAPKVIQACPLNVGEDYLMQKCKCGRKFYSICPDCSYRNGGSIPQTEEEHQDDLVDEMLRLTSDQGYRLENALQWMRVQEP